jgi:hypothetical protein
MDSKAMTKCRLKESERADLLLGPKQAAALSHFESCAACAQASAQQSVLFSALDAWTVPEVSAGFNRNLYAKIDAAMASPWYERWATAIRQTFAQPAFAVAAVALVTVGGFFLDHPAGLVAGRVTLSRTMQASPQHWTQYGTQHQATVQVSSTEAEQVERTLEDLEMLHQFDTSSEEKQNTQKSM